MRKKTSFTLDAETIVRIHKMAELWDVSNSQAVDRVVRGYTVPAISSVERLNGDAIRELPIREIITTPNGLIIRVGN